MIIPVIMLRKSDSTKTDVPCAIIYRQYKHFDAYHFVHDLHQMPWSDIAKRTDVDDALDAWMSCFVCVFDTHALVNIETSSANNSRTGSQETSLMPCKGVIGTRRKGEGMTIKVWRN